MFNEDQAAGLRALFTRGRPDVILACGGAQRQSAVVAEMARRWGEQGADVLVMDQTPGGVPAAYGLAARYELRHAIDGLKQLDEVTLVPAPGVRVLPAARGLDLLCGLSEERATPLKAAFGAALGETDTLIVNCRPLGAAAAAMAFSGGGHMVIVLDDSPQSLTAAYREVKALRLGCGMAQCDVILDAERPRAIELFDSLAAATQRFLDVTLTLQGALPGRSRPRSGTAVPVGPAHLAHARPAERAARTAETRPASHRINLENGHAAIC